MKSPLVSVLLLSAGLVVVACSHTPEEPGARPTSSAKPTTTPKPAATCPPDPEGGPPMLPTHTLVVRENHAQFTAELVYKPDDTERGLMYRTKMADDHGMLFKLHKQVQRFWMHNTCMSLDMLFLDEQGTVLGILQNVPTLNDEARSINQVSTYVLELAAGASSKYGVQAGQHFELPAAIRDLDIGR